MKKLLTVLLALAMAFTMVFATAASAEDGYKDSITWVIGKRTSRYFCSTREY